ncbi:hypothetical protein BGZ47_002646 [Haplosporangium gracile]|nr:hypothetical protein BGZ47_002646 [Haplosporangium gracile]
MLTSLRNDCFRSPSDTSTLSQTAGTMRNRQVVQFQSSGRENFFIDLFVEEDNLSSLSTGTLSSRSIRKRSAAGVKRDLDNAETSDENVQSSEDAEGAEGAESDEMAWCGSNTNDDADSEGHAVHDGSIDDEDMQIKVDYAE